jgi:hypothetical protein
VEIIVTTKIRFQLVDETPGALLYVEVDESGTPL